MKKILFYCVLMIIFVNDIIFAQTYDLSEISQARLVTSYSADTSVDEMDTVTFGSYPQSDESGTIKDPIEWLVLDNQGNKALLLSKYILNFDFYNKNNSNVKWENSTIRKWLNNEFYNSAFSDTEKISIINNIDKAFLLSLDDCVKYFYVDNMLSNGGGPGHFDEPKRAQNKKLATRTTEYMKKYEFYDERDNTYYDVDFGEGRREDGWWTGNSSYWLKGSETNDLNEPTAMSVEIDGQIREDAEDTNWVYEVSDGIRPALWVNTSTFANNFKAVATSDANGNISQNVNNITDTNLNNIGIGINGENSIINNSVDVETLNNVLAANKSNLYENKLYFYWWVTKNEKEKMYKEYGAVDANTYKLVPYGDDYYYEGETGYIGLFNILNKAEDFNWRDSWEKNYLTVSKYINKITNDKKYILKFRVNQNIDSLNGVEVIDNYNVKRMKITKKDNEIIINTDAPHFTFSGSFNPGYFMQGGTNSWSFFSYLENIKAIDFTNIVSSPYIDDLCCWFEGCKSLEKIDLSNMTFELRCEIASQLSNGYMFNDCASLKEIFFNDNISIIWNEIDTNYPPSTFSGCKSLQSINCNEATKNSFLKDESLNKSKVTFYSANTNSGQNNNVSSIDTTNNGTTTNNNSSNVQNAITQNTDKNFDISQILEVKPVTDYPTNTTVDNMDTIKFGNAEWVVLERQDDKALLFSKNIIEKRKYDDYYSMVTWNKCSLRQYMNSELMDKLFTNEEKNLILKTELENPGTERVSGGPNTEDYLFVLSRDEIMSYFKWEKRMLGIYFVDERVLPAKAEMIGNDYWLRGPGNRNWTIVEFHRDITGDCISDKPGGNENGVRPALWVDISALESSENNNVAVNNQQNTTTPDEKRDYLKNIYDTNNANNTSTSDSNYSSDYPTPEPTDIYYFMKELEESRKKIVDPTVYYYAKQDSTNKFITSIEKKDMRDGIFGTGLFAKTKKIYRNIEIKVDSATQKRLSKYADFDWHYRRVEDNRLCNWILLAGDSMNNLENISGFGLLAYSDYMEPAGLEVMTYYQKGKIQLNCSSTYNQDIIYNKLKNAKMIILTTDNVIKSHEEKILSKELLGGVTKISKVDTGAKSDEPHLNFARAYLDFDTEKAVVEYTKNNRGKYICLIDEYEGIMDYKEEIEDPKEECKDLLIWLYGGSSDKYARYAYEMLEYFKIYGCRLETIYELNTSDGFVDFEKRYKAAGIPYKVIKNDVKQYNSMSDDNPVDLHLNKNDIVFLQEVDGDWAKINSFGFTKYVKLSDISEVK